MRRRLLILAMVLARFGYGAPQNIRLQIKSEGTEQSIRLERARLENGVEVYQGVWRKADSTPTIVSIPAEEYDRLSQVFDKNSLWRAPRASGAMQALGRFRSLGLEVDPNGKTSMVAELEFFQTNLTSSRKPQVGRWPYATHGRRGFKPEELHPFTGFGGNESPFLLDSALKEIRPIVLVGRERVHGKEFYSYVYPSTAEKITRGLELGPEDEIYAAPPDDFVIADDDLRQELLRHSESAGQKIPPDPRRRFLIEMVRFASRQHFAFERGDFQLNFADNPVAQAIKARFGARYSFLKGLHPRAEEPLEEGLSPKTPRPEEKASGPPVGKVKGTLHACGSRFKSLLRWLMDE